MTSVSVSSTLIGELSPFIVGIVSVVSSLIGAGAALLAGHFQRRGDLNRAFADRRRDEDSVRQYFAAAVSALHEVVDLQVRTGGVWHGEFIDAPHAALRNLYENATLVVLLTPESVRKIGRALADARIASIRWKEIIAGEFEIDDDMTYPTAKIDSDAIRARFKELFRGTLGSLATALEELKVNPSTATYAGRD